MKTIVNNKKNIFILYFLVVNNLIFTSSFSQEYFEMQENLEKQQDSLMPFAPEPNSWNSGLLEAGTETSTTDEVSEPINDQKKWCTGLFCLDPEIHVPKRSICLGALTGLSALGVPIYLGTAAAPITSLCLGNFSSAIKGLVPKSENNKAKQIAIMIAMASCGAGLDFTSTFLGFPTNFAFSGLCGAAATATLKKGMKAFLYDDITAQKERFRLEKEQAKAKSGKDKSGKDKSGKTKPKNKSPEKSDDDD